MKLKKSIYVFFVFAMVFVVSCSHYDTIQANLIESSSGSDESHNFGENCGSCHNKSGNEAASGNRWWTVSGSVYKSGNNPQKNAFIELWEKPNRQGKLYKRIATDSEGNFYTNQIFDFNKMCYPSIVVGSNYKNMSPAYSGGSCNSCHGISAKTLVIN